MASPVAGGNDVSVYVETFLSSPVVGGRGRTCVYALAASSVAMIGRIHDYAFVAPLGQRKSLCGYVKAFVPPLFGVKG